MNIFIAMNITQDQDFENLASRIRSLDFLNYVSSINEVIIRGSEKQKLLKTSSLYSDVHQFRILLNPSQDKPRSRDGYESEWRLRSKQRLDSVIPLITLIYEAHLMSVFRVIYYSSPVIVHITRLPFPPAALFLCLI